MTLGAYDPNTARERPVGALGGEYNVFGRGDRRSVAGGMYARGLGSNAAQILEGSNSFGQCNAVGNDYAGGLKMAMVIHMAKDGTTRVE